MFLIAGTTALGYSMHRRSQVSILHSNKSLLAFVVNAKGSGNQKHNSLLRQSIRLV